jgi:diguanylate cyclase (GGDEF)-like protein
MEAVAVGGQDHGTSAYRAHVFDALSDAVLVIGLGGVVLDCNLAAAGLLARPREAIVGSVPDLWGVPFLQVLAAVRQSGRWAAEVPLAELDDARRVGAATVVGLYGPQDRLTAVAVTVTEITDWVVAAATAARAAAQQAAIIEAQAGVAAVELSSGAVHDEICTRAMHLTRAAGAVLELREGDEMVYHGTAGIARGFTGMQVPMRGSFSGRCMTEERALLCEDAETDPRVDPEACRKIGLRSMVVVPLRHGGRTTGVLKVFSPRPADFSVEDQVALEWLAAPFGAALANAQRMEATFVRATTDPLTGLGNRSHAQHELDRALSRQARSRAHTAVMFLDLDGFKAVNDRLGHEAGDLVLTGVADRIRSTLRDTDTAARYGGDEFLVVCESFTTTDDVHRLAERLLETIRRPYPVGGGEFARIGASIGIAIADAGATAVDVLQAADQAMYRVKRDGGSCYATVHAGSSAPTRAEPH